MHQITTLLTLIMTGLRAAIAAHIARPHAEAAIMPWTREPELRPGDARPGQARPARPPLPASLLAGAADYIGRTLRRLERLIARWHTNTLPAPPISTSSVRAPRAPRPAPTEPNPRLPRGRAWLAAAAGYHTRGHASQLHHLIESPDFKTFLAEAPQAARLLRPLCHILGIAPHLALPPTPSSQHPRAPRIRPSRPAPHPPT